MYYDLHLSKTLLLIGTSLGRFHLLTLLQQDCSERSNLFVLVTKMAKQSFGFGFAVSWFRGKVVDPLIQILRRGTEPKQLAFSAALGFTFGVFPICGVPMFFCGMAIAVLKSLCHAPTVMLTNFVVTPIELSLMVPFLRFGELITGGPHFPLTSDALKKVFTGQASREVLHSIGHALLGWLVAAPFMLGALYLLALPCFIILVRKFSTLPSSPKKPLINSPRAEVRLKVRDV